MYKVIVELWPKLANVYCQPMRPSENLSDWTEWAISVDQEDDRMVFNTSCSALSGIGHVIDHLVYGCMSDCLGETGEKIKMIFPPVLKSYGSGQSWQCPLSDHDVGKYCFEHAEELGLEFVFRKRAGGREVFSRPLTMEVIEAVTGNENVTHFN